jgi:ABC-type sugar transport system ATPase subunit
MILAAEKINKRYDAEVLCDCSLMVRSGECVIVNGPSGGGKSTLLRILARLESADSGSVVHGAYRWDARVTGSEPVYPFLTLVFQQLFLWPNLTLAQNLAIVLAHAPRAKLPAQTLELLERLSIVTLLERKPHECSLGQRQRLAIARALLGNARFLLLDEPSSALDRVNRQIFAKELAEAKARGRGILIVTHDERDFDGIADQRLTLDNGFLQTL